MPNKIPEIHYEDCIACSMCVIVCPVSSLEMNKTGIDSLNKVYPSLTDRPCTGCALCEKQCPMGCIIMKVMA